MDRAKKKFASAIDGLRSLTGKTELVVEERIQTTNCCLTKLVRHGFPDDPRCMAYDPVQRLLAIGTGRGTVRMLGDTGVDYLLKHETDSPVNFIQFLVNEGGLITACANDTLCLWNFRQKVPEIVHVIQMTKETVTSIHLPLSSKWLYVGTEKGNVYFVSVGTFQLSPYVINWNKAIDLSCRVHPGAVKALSACPIDSTKLLILFDKGILILWNLQTKEVDRFPLEMQVKSVSWHFDGKQIMTGNFDGSVCIFNCRKTMEPTQKSTPHGSGPCRPIVGIDWKHSADGEQVIVFAGGTPADDAISTPMLTILRASRSATVLELEHGLISFSVLPQVPYTSCPQQPHAVAVLLKNSLMVVDLLSPGYPCIENPHVLDLHESPVTALAYYSDCPSDLLGALTLVGCKQRKKGLSDKPWPINGGEGRECATGHQEIVITGHKDGTIRFWQASGETLQILYRVKTASHFERSDEDSRASHEIKGIVLDLDSRLLVAHGVSGQVTLFRFMKSESTHSIAVVNVPGSVPSTSSNDEKLKERGKHKRMASRESTHSSDTSDSADESAVALKVRGAALRRPAGYQPELVCLVGSTSSHSIDSVTTTAINSAFGILAIGTVYGLALVDVAQCALIYAWNTAELYGAESTPCVQLGDGSSSPAELERAISEQGTAPEMQRSSMSMKLSLKKTKRGVVGILRRNTAELASAIRDKYRDHSTHHNANETDRPTIDEQSSESSWRVASALSRVSVEGKQRSFDRRPTLFKAQSVIEHGSRSSAGENNSRDSPAIRSHSPSNSSHSLDALGLGEYVTSIAFVLSPFKRGGCEFNDQTGQVRSIPSAFRKVVNQDCDAKSCPSLWVGTSSGATMALALQLPMDRNSNTVVVTPSGTVVRMKGQMLLETMLDASLALIEGPSESFKESSRESVDGESERSLANKVITKPSSCPTLSNAADVSEDIQNYLVAASEWEIKVLTLPAFSQVFSLKFDDIPLVKVSPSHIQGSPILMCLSAAGESLVVSLPSLRLLNRSPLFPHSVDVDDPVCRRTAFSEHGLGVYMSSPVEMEKYTMCADVSEQVADSLGELFVACDMPEAPRGVRSVADAGSSFLKGVSSMFSSTSKNDSLDLDSILGSQNGEKTTLGASSAAGMRTVGRSVPTTNMERAQSGGISAGQAAQMAMQNLNERGEKLNMVVDATENLRNNAMNMAQRTSKLAEKYEKKKWYNF